MHTFFCFSAASEWLCVCNDNRHWHIENNKKLHWESRSSYIPHANLQVISIYVKGMAHPRIDTERETKGEKDTSKLVTKSQSKKWIVEYFNKLHFAQNPWEFFFGMYGNSRFFFLGFKCIPSITFAWDLFGWKAQVFPVFILSDRANSLYSILNVYGKRKSKKR